MLNIDGKGRCMQSKKSNDVCECCLCDPCDCHGMNDELWRMGQTECHQRGQNTCMVGARNRDQSKSGQQVEEREHSTHSVFFEDNRLWVITSNINGRTIKIKDFL